MLTNSVIIDWGRRGLTSLLGVWIASLWACSSAPERILEATGTPKGATPTTLPTHEVFELPTSRVHVVILPPDTDYRLTVEVADGLATLPELAEQGDAIAAINAGFFDPQNGLTTSYVRVAGEWVADPRQNPRLMENPDLAPYLAAILNRSEFRVYRCPEGEQYAINRHFAPVPDTCELWHAVGAGPQLLPTMTGIEEGFLAQNAAGEEVRDALGSRYPNARSAVGLKPDGTVVLAVATQRLDVETATGLSLPQMAEFLSDLGVTIALNLDGGSSSGLFWRGTTYYGRLNAEEQPVVRPIKSVLMVR